MTTLDLPGLDAIRPADVTDYLRHAGWRPIGQAKNDVIYYQYDPARLIARLGREPDGPLRVQVLLDVQFADYTRRTAELVEALAELERRSVWQIVNDLLTPPADIARLRTTSEDTRSGLIDLEDSIRLRQAARDLLLACAHAAVLPRAFYPRLGYAQALKLLSECREGQTERGSYVASIHVPVSPLIEPPAEAIEAPYARRVTTLFMAALLETQAISARGEASALTRGEDRGLSANFFDALSRLRPPGERSFLDLGITWSRNRPAPDLPRSSVRFEQGSFAVFAEVARVMRESASDTSVELDGYIVRCQREENDPSRPGTVIMIAQLEARPGTSKIRVELEAEDYNRALDLHKRAVQVKMAGRLRKEGRAFYLHHATLLDVIPNATDLDYVDP